jgi:hypothetical protein
MTTSTQDYSRTLTKPIETTLATVTAVPDGVYFDIDLKTQSGELTPVQARQLGEMLIEAAHDAEHIDFANDDPDDITLRDDRV